jgi:hypothetical protein
MNKIPYYAKRVNGPYPHNYPHANYTGYIHPHKKNFFKNRPKPNNIQMNNNYFENRNKNFNYNNNFNSFNYNSNHFNNFSNFNGNANSYHSSVFQKNKYFHRYTPYFTEEKKIAEEIKDDSVIEEEEKKEEVLEELLRIRINVGDGQSEELILYKKDDIYEKVVEFCKNNSISEKLVEPLINKVNQSLDTLEIINNMNLKKNDYLILDRVKNISDGNKNN